MKKYILVEKSKPYVKLGESNDRAALQGEADDANRFPEPGKEYIVVNRYAKMAVRVVFLAFVAVLGFLTCN